MYKSCSRCGKVHPYNFKCSKGKRVYKYDRPDEDKLRYTNEWIKKTKAIKEASRWLCSVCEDQGRFTYENLETNHVIKIRDAPEKFLDDDNLICLCTFHHRMAEKGMLEKEYLRKLAKLRNERCPLG